MNQNNENSSVGSWESLYVLLNGTIANESLSDVTQAEMLMGEVMSFSFIEVKHSHLQRLTSSSYKDEQPKEMHQ